MGLVAVVCFVSLLQTVLGASNFKCPSGNGFFPDPEQCDMYYECRRGVAHEKLCPDGMAFLANNPLYGRCDFTPNVDCSSRPYLQNAKPSKKCPRSNGYFPHEDPKACGEFYQCHKGVASTIACQKGLAFNPAVGGCEWAAKVPGCEHLARHPEDDSSTHHGETTADYE
ncbi:protein obstructor-E-like [Ornithodoros turicata]